MTGDIRIYGEVGKQVTFESVIRNIDPKYDSYDVHIMSPGGDVFEGYAIYNALLNTGKEINVYIEGLCASIATLIAAAGKRIIMNKQSQFMIHNPMISGTQGDANDLRNVADQLDKIKTQLINVYQAKTGLSKETLWTMYDNETWLMPEQALEMGFVDEVRESLKAVATANIKTFKNMETNKLKSLLASIKNLLNGTEEVKNQMPETLEDGTAIVVLSEDGDFTGKQVVYEDGTPLPAGNHTLASGKVLVVGEGGVISEIQDPAASADATDGKPPETSAPDALAEMQAKLDAQTEEIANLKSAIEARNSTAAAAEAKAQKFENKLKSTEKQLETILNTSVGGDQNPDLGINNGPQNRPGIEQYDPMGEEILRNLRSRNLVK